MKGIACPSAGIVTRPATLPGCSGAQPSKQRKIGQIRSGSCTARSDRILRRELLHEIPQHCPVDTVAPPKGHLVPGSTTRERFSRSAGWHGGHLALRARRAPALHTNTKFRTRAWNDCLLSVPTIEQGASPDSGHIPQVAVANAAAEAPSAAALLPCLSALRAPRRTHGSIAVKRSYFFELAGLVRHFRVKCPEM
jgi:hypothetical protein